MFALWHSSTNFLNSSLFSLAVLLERYSKCGVNQLIGLYPQKFSNPLGASFGSKQNTGSNSILVMPSFLRYGIFFKNFLKQLSSS